MQVHSTVRSCSHFIRFGNHVKADFAFRDPINVFLISAVEAKMRRIAGKNQVIENLFP